MTDRIVIDSSQLPMRLPIFQTMTLWLFMDRLSAGPLAWGIVGTLYGLACIGILVCVFSQKARKVAWEAA